MNFGLLALFFSHLPARVQKQSCLGVQGFESELAWLHVSVCACDGLATCPRCSPSPDDGWERL